MKPLSLIMLALWLFAALFGLCSCSVPIPENDFIEGEFGKFKRTSPFDQNGRWGFLFTRPEDEIIISDKP